MCNMTIFENPLLQGDQMSVNSFIYWMFYKSPRLGICNFGSKQPSTGSDTLYYRFRYCRVIHNFNAILHTASSAVCSVTTFLVFFNWASQMKPSVATFFSPRLRLSRELRYSSYILDSLMKQQQQPTHRARDPQLPNPRQIIGYLQSYKTLNN